MIQPYTPDVSLAGKLRRRFTRLTHKRPARLDLARPIVSFTFDDIPASAAHAGAEALEQHGAELVMINALSAECLPDGLHGLYIGGGFPETSAQALADNHSFRLSLRQAIEQGLPVYAECGGLIYLGRSLLLDGKEYPLTGIFPVSFSLAAKPQAHGYSILQVEGGNSFYEPGLQIKGHEFRYSKVQQWSGTSKNLVFKVQRGTGFYEGRDGLVYKNVLAL